MNETPDIRRSTYGSSAVGLANLEQYEAAARGAHQQHNMIGQLFGRAVNMKVTPEPEEMMPPAPPTTARRLVQVFILDPYESVPLDQCLLYKGELKLTDLTDQELFYEIDIKSILEAHNKKRVEIVDKKVKERVEKLEPARIRDLRMQIVTVAQF